MGKIFGIADLPIAKPFPSLDFGKTEMIEKAEAILASKPIPPDTYVKQKVKSNFNLKKIFNYIKQHK